MILIINTAAENKITIALAHDDGDLILGKVLLCIFEHSEKLLQAVDSLLQETHVNLKVLKGIIVVSGPGGFTALRVAVVTANTLAFALKIPVVGVKLSEFNSLQGLIKIGLSKIKKTKTSLIILPYYGREPHITKPKAKY